MNIKKVEIVPIKPREGLIGFASIVIGDCFYLSSIGVHTRLDGKGFRITYPTKKVGDVNVAIFHPLGKELSKEIEQAIFEKAAQIFV